MNLEPIPQLDPFEFERMAEFQGAPDGIIQNGITRNEFHIGNRSIQERFCGHPRRILRRIANDREDRDLSCLPPGTCV